MMKTEIKAVVFKTPRLRETKLFYSRDLGLKIVESSNYHFVIDVPGLRLMFVKGNRVSVEIYITHADQITDRNGIAIHEDQNGIKLVVC